MSGGGIGRDEIENLYRRLFAEAEAGGYHLNPEVAFTLELIEGLLLNERRYGYWACPCRLASGVRSEDLDIICPCDYRDPDLDDHDACYCGLYVTQKVQSGKRAVRPIPERRPAEEERGRAVGKKSETVAPGTLPYPVWRCKVCGYLCARDNPPESCPVCKAKKDRFERFL
ncbi:MAG TPA: ferredoxin-thioredoxin reductase catalytic domain-containing protein [Spirochaetota bacterium]|nr:ferredoxin-thioredoxin reductase catalytic domain-containing protein [Spirochaetota bacterium]